MVRLCAFDFSTVGMPLDTTVGSGQQGKGKEKHGPWVKQTFIATCPREIEPRFSHNYVHRFKS